MVLPLKWDEEEPVKTTEAEVIQDNRSGQFGRLPASKLVCPLCGATKNGSTAICPCGGVLPIRLPDSGTSKPAIDLSVKPKAKTAPRISRPPERQIQEQKEPSEALRINRGRCLSCGSLLLSSFICVKCGAKLMPQTPQTEAPPQVSSPSFLSKLVGVFILGVVFGLLATQIADRLKCSGTLWTSPSSEKTPQVK